MYAQMQHEFQVIVMGGAINSTTINFTTFLMTTSMIIIMYILIIANITVLCNKSTYYVLLLHTCANRGTNKQELSSLSVQSET